LIVGGKEVEIVRKPIKNFYIRVVPPDGQVRVSVPDHMPVHVIERMVLARQKWILRQQTRLRSRPQTTVPDFVTGETHFFLGQPFSLEVVEFRGPQGVSLKGNVMELRIRPGRAANVEPVLQTWYRSQLKERIPFLLEKWHPVMNVEAHEWGVRRMRTRWGTCNTSARRIWLSLELPKQPESCLEYVVVHELGHLIEPSHNARFWSIMDHYLPDWKIRRQMLHKGLVPNNCLS